MFLYSYLYRYFIIVLLAIFTFPYAVFANNVKDFGAKGDGKTDDTNAIYAAIAGNVDGLITFPKGNYRITRTIEINLATSGVLGISGNGGSARVIMEGEGPAFRIIGSHDKGSALPSSIKPITWEKERMPLIDDIEILGANPKADGIQLHNTMQPTLRGVLIRDTRNGIHLTSRNRNVIIDACHVYNSSGIGIFLDAVNIHQMIISASHISYNKKSGIKVTESQIRNFQITGSDIEYNCDPEGEVSADIWIDCSKGGVVREGTIVGNTIQAIQSPGGSNIRFTGKPGTPDKVGLWSISDNHIGNQDINIYLENARGITITGNVFMRGYARNVIVENSKNIVFNGNTLGHNPDYFRNKPLAIGGVTVKGSQNILLTNNIIEGIDYGSEKSGGAIEIIDSREILVNSSQIKNPKFHGITIKNSALVNVSDCLINEDEGNRRMLTGILLSDNCSGTTIRGNSVSRGKNGGIVNRATGVQLKDNFQIK